MYRWLIGVSLVVFDTLLGTLGKQLMRKSHSPDSHSSWYLLVLGVFLVSVVNPLLSVVSYAFASPSLLAPFAGLSIAWNIVLSPLMLKERVSREDVLGAFVIIVGVVLISVYGLHESSSYNYESLLRLFSQWPFVWFVRVELLVLSILLSMSLLSNPKSTNGLVGYGVLSGCLGGNQYLVKTALEMIRGYSNDDTLIIDGTSLLIMASAVLSSAGLKRYPALQLLPLYQGSFIVVGSVSSLLFFEEYHYVTVTKESSPTHHPTRIQLPSFAYYLVGLFLVVFGIVYISSVSFRKFEEGGHKISIDSD